MRVARPNEVLGLEFLPKTLGYRLQFTAKPSDYLTELEKSRKVVNASTSIGLIMSEEGKISSVVPGSAADKAALAGGMTISGVNGRKFSGQRLRDGIANSVGNRKIELLILDGDTFRTVKLDYGDGPKYLELTRSSEHPDTLAAILKPLIKEEKK